MIRRIAVLLFVAALTPACTSQAPNPFQLDPNIKSEFNEEPEADFLARNPQIAKRNGAELTLFFANRKTVTLKDNREEDCDNLPEGEAGSCYIAYRVVGYWPRRDLFLLDILFYEGSSSALFGNDGSAEYIPGRPVFSPDVSRFAAFSQDCFFYFAADISVFDFVDRQPVEFFSDTTGEGIGVESIHWINRNRLQVDLFDCRDGFGDDKIARWQSYLQKRRDNSWVWEGNSTQIPERTAR